MLPESVWVVSADMAHKIRAGAIKPPEAFFFWPDNNRFAVRQPQLGPKQD